MLRSVILLHTTPDGDSHYDWMIECDEPDTEHRLMTWRSFSRPDDPIWDGFCESIARHRAAYLEYEGVVSGGRGQVCRVASGEVVGLEASPNEVEVAIQWANRRIVYRGRSCSDGADWIFTVCEITHETAPEG